MYSPERYQQNKEHYNAKSKAWREKNPERAKENRKRNYELNKERNLQYSKEYNLQRKFKLSLEEYQVLSDKQGNVCAICGSSCTRSLAVDHNHNTGEIRGLLCNSCNRGIGYLKDSPDILRKAISYLEKES